MEVDETTKNKEDLDKKGKEEEEENEFPELDPIKIPQYLIDINTFISSTKIAFTKDLSNKNVLMSIIYGINCNRLYNNKYLPCTIFQINPEHQILSITNPKSTKVKREIEHIDITEISHVSLFREEKPRIAININTISLTFQFDNNIDLFILLKAFLLLFEKYICSNDNLPRNRALKIWQKYDKDFNNVLDYNEFSSFYTDFNMSNISNSYQISKDELFNSIDTNKDRSISFDEFSNFYSSLTNGNEYQDLFIKYSSDLIYLHVKDLKNFIENEQKERCTLIQCAGIIISYSQEFDPKQKIEITEKLKNKAKFSKEEEDSLKMTLDEFKLFIISKDNSAMKIYNQKEIDMTKPLNHYYINSSYNTFLNYENNVDLDMFGILLLNGVRYLELRCYNADNTGDIIIKGNNMFSNKLYLKNVLSDIKAKAFDKYDYPVILNIINYMSDDKSQELLMQECQDILQNIYILDEKNLPINYPSPENLKNKFIINLSGERIISKKVGNKYITCSNYDENLEASKSDEGNIFLKKKRNLKVEPEIDIEKINSLEQIINKESSNLEKSQNQGKTAKNIFPLTLLRGIHTVPFTGKDIKIKTYKPWELIEFDYNKIEHMLYDYDSRQIFINLSHNSFVKTIPSSDSDNYNPINCWTAGCQIASLNHYLMNNEYILLNKMFFTAYGDTGYMPKPKKIIDDISENYDFPYGTVTLKILYGYGLDKIAEKLDITNNNNNNEQRNIKIECSVLGSQSDENNNKKYSIAITGNFIIPQIEKNECEFKIYEKELSALCLKLIYNDIVIGRSIIPICALKKGLRTIQFYDEKYTEFKNVSLVVSLNKQLEGYKKKY